MGAHSQIYYGRNMFMSATGDDNNAREALARLFNLTKLPPSDIEVTEDSDDTNWERFIFSKSGSKYIDIIDSITEFNAKEKILEVEDEMIGLFIDPDDDIEYILKYYNKELKEKLFQLYGPEYTLSKVKQEEYNITWNNETKELKLTNGKGKFHY